MKKIYYSVVIGYCLLLGFADKQPVQALEHDPCYEYRRTKGFNNITFPIGFQKGVEVKSVSWSPTYPVVIGQDEKRDGVNLTIQLESTEAKVDNYKWNGKYEKSYGSCKLYSDREITEYGDDIESCGPYFGNTGYGFYRTVWDDHSKPICNLDPNDPIKVHRMILMDTLRVYLIPTDQTRDWLGWTTGEGTNSTYPLRFMYPESWALTQFSGDNGFNVDPFADATSIFEQYYYDYLKADPYLQYIPSRTLMRMPKPTGDITSGLGIDILALYGKFDIYSGSKNIVEGTPSCSCLISPDNVRNQMTALGNSRMYDNLQVGTCGTDPPNACPDSVFNTAQADIFNLTLTLNHIPMDLPGEWQVGIYFETTNAMDINNYREPWEDLKATRVDNFLFTPEDYKPKDSYTFSVYILLTTPCNELEKDSCTT